MTVHRIQGHLYFNDSFFADGQGYVALSRFETLDKIHFLTFDEKAIFASSVVKDILSTAKDTGKLKVTRHKGHSTVNVEHVQSNSASEGTTIHNKSAVACDSSNIAHTHNDIKCTDGKKQLFQTMA